MVMYIIRFLKVLQASDTAELLLQEFKEGQWKAKRVEVQRKCQQPLWRRTYGASMIPHTCTDSHSLLCCSDDGDLKG